MFKHNQGLGFQRHSRSMNWAKYALLLSTLGLVVAVAFAQTQKAVPSAKEFSDISGMYSFEREGEFVQVTVEQRPAEQPTGKADKAKPLAVTGYISRYADTDSDRGAFLDYFIDKGSLDGNKITFVTKPVHGIFYEFTGQVSRGVVTKDKDGYYELRGTLTQNILSQDKTTSARSREITMKLYPDLDSPPKAKSL